jgi:hypothetical protein
MASTDDVNGANNDGSSSSSEDSSPTTARAGKSGFRVDGEPDYKPTKV